MEKLNKLVVVVVCRQQECGKMAQSSQYLIYSMEWCNSVINLMNVYISSRNIILWII